MSADDNGGPAFPAPEAGQQHFSDPSAYTGMTLRDYFAAKAMQPLLANDCASSPSRLAEEAYAMADAMLAERAKVKP